MVNKSALLIGSILLALLLLFAAAVRADKMDEDRAECGDKLTGLATCLPYVGGDSDSPTLDCCTGLKQVVQNSTKCLCVLLNDRNDPNLGLKLNSTIAFNLPRACHVPTNISNCVHVLHLAPNSSEAKVFEGFANTTRNSRSDHGGSSTSSASEGKSDGGRMLEMAFGTSIGFLAPQLVLYL